MLFRPLLLVALSLCVAACAAPGYRPEPAPDSYPWPSPPPSGPPAEPIPGMPSPIPQPVPEPVRPPQQNYPRSASEISGAAVVSLIGQARAQRDAGNPALALATLERAKGIEPRNYFIWAAMAQANLAQGNFEQAESIAQKSNSLARGNLYVEVENWKTIAQARQARGDAAGAVQAQARADEIERTLSGG